MDQQRASIVSRRDWRRDTACDADELLTHPNNELLDILALCPNLLATARRHGKHNVSIGARLDAVAQCQNLLDRLRTWRKRWDCTGPSVLQQIRSGMNSNPAPELHRVQLAELCDRTFFMLHHCTLIRLLQVCEAIKCRVHLDSMDEQHFVIDDSFTNCVATTAMQQAAIEICQCLPTFASYEGDPDAGSMMIWHMAVKAAWEVLEGSGTPEVRWLEAFLRGKTRKVFARGLWTQLSLEA